MGWSMENYANSFVDRRDLTYRIARKWVRLFNIMIDTFVFYLLMLLLVSSINLYEWIGPENTKYITLFYLILYVLYFVLFELIFSRTPAKMLTRTRVVTKDGVKPGAGRIVGRSFLRIIPFDAFSFLFSDKGWHDEISGTIVVHTKR